MDLVYRIMGIAAAIGSFTSRGSINFVKLNWLLMIALGFALTATTREARFAMDNGTTPRAITVAEALAHNDHDRNFVAVGGTLADDVVFEYRTTSHDKTTVEASYYALMDPAAHRAMLVRTKGTARPSSSTGEVILTGMMMPIESSLRTELLSTGGRVDDLPFDTDYVLEAGRTPGNLVSCSIGVALCAIALLAMLATWRSRYLVFRVGDSLLEAPVDTQLDDSLDLRASGRFSLASQKPRHFLSVPVALADADGAPVLAAFVDASTRFLGIKSADRKGVWTIPLPREGVEQLDVGYQYLGLRRKPALRIHHNDGGKAMRTVISCRDPQQCRALAALLKQPWQARRDDSADAG